MWTQSGISWSQMKLKRYETAVLDADAALALNSGYVKGYSTKGAALIMLGRAADAVEALKEGLSLDGSNQTLKDNLVEAEQLLASGGGTPAGATPATGLQGYLMGNRAAMMASAKGIATGAVLALTLAYLFLPNPTSSSWFYTALALCPALHVTHIIEGAGTPAFTTEYGAKVVRQESTYLAFTCVTFMQVPPTLVALIPLVLYDLVHFGYWVYGLLSLTAPGAAASASGLVDSVMPQVTGQAEWGSMAPGPRYALLSSFAQTVVAQLQVMLGLFLVVNLLTPSRSFIGLFLHWRNLQMQVQVGGFPHLTQAFTGIDAQILGLTGHQYCPAVVRTGYGSLRGWLASMAKPPTSDGGAGGGLMSKCTIQ